MFAPCGSCCSDVNLNRQCIITEAHLLSSRKAIQPTRQTYSFAHLTTFQHCASCNHLSLGPLNYIPSQDVTWSQANHLSRLCVSRSLELHRSLPVLCCSQYWNTSLKSVGLFQDCTIQISSCMHERQKLFNKRSSPGFMSELRLRVHLLQCLSCK
jgi:hypothetical protein